MYFPESRGEKIKKFAYLIKRLSDWKEEYEYNYSCIEWRAVLISEGNEDEKKWKLFSSVFYAHPKNYQEEENIIWLYPYSSDETLTDYGFQTRNVLLIRKYVEFEDITSLLKKLTLEGELKESKAEEKNEMSINFAEQDFYVDVIRDVDWNFESHVYEYVDWPFYQISLQLSSNLSDLPFPLFAENNPYFNSSSFSQSFFNTPGLHPSKSYIYIMLPLYEAKIEWLHLAKKTLSFKVINNTGKPLVLKMLLRCGRFLGEHKEIIIPTDKEIDEIVLDKDYEQIQVVLSKQGSSYYLQEQSVGQRPIKLEGITTPNNLEELREFTKVGEDQKREFKREFNKATLLKEMIAFANTNDGIICVGVEDDGVKYVGEEKEPQTIKTSLADYVGKMCDPPDLEYEIMHFELGDDKHIYLVIVPEGKEKPYYHLDHMRFYVRAQASSRPITRDELLKIKSERSGY